MVVVTCDDQKTEKIEMVTHKTLVMIWIVEFYSTIQISYWMHILDESNNF